MSKLSFRARALDASKPMPVYMAEELPDLPEYSAINRAVPQMPSGMEKEEECEHHLQRAICAGLIIPTPEVSEANVDAYDKLYPPNYKQPRQLIHMQPFAMEQDIPDYDMDTEDERWLVSQAKKLDLTPLKFEEMMDRLEKSSGQTVVTLNEAKALLKEDDDLIIAVFDYWLNKRLKTQHPLILSVKTEHRTGSAANNPYLAFRRRTEKMQTRKNRKNDETSYEKMLKLRRDLSRAVTLLELVKRREKTKREYLHLTIEIYEKRYQAHDFTGTMLAEVSALKASRPAFTQIFQNHYGGTQAWMGKAAAKDETVPRKEKRQYKKRKHKNSSAHGGRLSTMPGSGIDGMVSSDEEEPLPVVHSPEPEENDEEGQFAFRRNKLCTYHMPIANGLGNWPWCPPQENGLADRRYRYTLTSLAHPRRCVGFARRRVGRGGRVILDRAATDYDDIWRELDFSVIDAVPAAAAAAAVRMQHQHQMVQPSSDSSIVISETNGVGGGGAVKNSDGDGVKCEVKCEPTDEQRTDGVVGDFVSERDDMLEFLREIKRDWLHFRPKTPPAAAAAASADQQLDELDPLLHLTNTTPITVELQTMSSTCPSTLLDDSLFTTSSFTLQDLYSDTVPDVVSFDDTRQTTSSAAGAGACSDPALDRTFGCSRFRVCDSAVTASVPSRVTSLVVDVPTTPPSSKKQSILSSTLTSPKFNSVSVSPSSSSIASAAAAAAVVVDGRSSSKLHVYNHVSNGPLSHTELIGRKGNKMQHNAYSSGPSASAAISARCAAAAAAATTSTLNNISSSCSSSSSSTSSSSSGSETRTSTSVRLTNTSTISNVSHHHHHHSHQQHTLNSHSANIMDINSLSNESSSSSSGDKQHPADNNKLQQQQQQQQQQNNKQQQQQQQQGTAGASGLVRKNNTLPPMEVT